MKNIIVLIGGPGSGKGTVAEKLCKINNFNCIETGALFRSLPPDSKISKLIADGNFAPDSELFKLIKTNINNSKDIILDGFPRTLPQAKWLVENYHEKFEIKIIYLDIPEKIMKERIKNRLSHGSERADDRDDSIIMQRLDNFHEITMPAIKWLRDHHDSIKFFYIDGRPDIDTVMENILRILK